VESCQSDADCPLGFICENQQCVEGCVDDRDCPRGTWCDNGQCVEGCTSDQDCPWGTHCLLELHECVECFMDDHCMGQNRFCDLDTYTCYTGCTEDAHCENFGMVCDTSTDPGVCVECYAGDTSICDDQGMVCDVDARECVECLEDADCQTAGNISEFCLPDMHTCVECYLDDHCLADEACNLETFECMSLTGRELCEPCTVDSECGDAGDLCLSFTNEAGDVVDMGCGRSCGLADTCPDGYRCAPTGDSYQCTPHNAEPTPTCAGIRAMEMACAGWGAECGAELADDGTCIPILNMCTVACDVDAILPMCIEGWQCESFGGVYDICLPQQ
jgi:Cys-rich repeat protein